jgi:hypothetical protein
MRTGARKQVSLRHFTKTGSRLNNDGKDHRVLAGSFLARLRINRRGKQAPPEIDNFAI